MRSFLDPYLSIAKIQEIRLQAWTIHTVTEARWFTKPEPTTDTLADARRQRKERRKNK